MWLIVPVPMLLNQEQTHSPKYRGQRLPATWKGPQRPAMQMKPQLQQA